ncbi:MAG: FtsB family cell division protein [Myxococcota bacterium]
MFEAKSAIAIRRVLLVLLLGGVLGVVAAKVVDPARTARRAMLERHHGRLETLNHRLERENVRLESELRSLETGLEGWKQVARREHGMLLPGEVIFRFPPQDR